MLVAVDGERVLHHQLGRGGGEADTVLGHAGEGAGVLREDLLDHQGGAVVVVVVDVKVLGGLDDCRLPEPGDLRPRAAFNPAGELGGGTVGSSLGLDALQDTGRTGLFVRLRG